ncbi:4,5-DOPA dioxygenase extradiol [Breznakiella homolactica]|uniref:4,5-DOPA dioxygenase extradiol n=1 Tax=Breznakiella homolactica TaxID=2798577 RepID=A0A7T8B9X9_9SPIR|nr:4,5-DOPA dioxygenase extradiol [Breznakiella homolactica]QQO08781.1 4,5-DOPA dioxygenase extradiol [Breznakiella homolactica]
MKRMPVVFAGHGSPMNIVEQNQFTRGWAAMAEALPKPEAILCVSAHWFGPWDAVSETGTPETIHDFYGFPEELYAVQYPAPGAPDLARRTVSLMGPGTEADSRRGLDHGAWSVLHCMYPGADIPVCQLSVNAGNSPMESYLAGQKLSPLREEGVLILGSGNIVHNLSLVDWNRSGGYPWADEFDGYIRAAVEEGRYDAAVNYDAAGPSARRAFSSRDHYDPLLYTLGAADSGDPVRIFNSERVMGSLSMTSYIIG